MGVLLVTALSPQVPGSARLRPVSGPGRARRPPARRIGLAAGVVVLVAAALLVISPVVWAVSTSLRTPATSFNQPPAWIPWHPVWSNYRAVFQQVPLVTFFVNSMIITGLIVVIQLITSTCDVAGHR